MNKYEQVAANLRNTKEIIGGIGGTLSSAGDVHIFKKKDFDSIPGDTEVLHRGPSEYPFELRKVVDEVIFFRLVHVNEIQEPDIKAPLEFKNGDNIFYVNGQFIFKQKEKAGCECESQTS